MRRNVLVVLLGLAFLVLMTWLGSVVVDSIPRPATAQTQTIQAGPYQITLQVHPKSSLMLYSNMHDCTHSFL